MLRAGVDGLARIRHSYRLTGTVPDTVAVLGPGAVGGALGVRMARGGERVICVAKPEAARSIAEEGFTLRTDGGEHTERLAAVTELEEPVDLLLVTVKAYALDDALARIGAEPGLVLPLLNGLEHMEALRARFRSVVGATIGGFEGYKESTTLVVQQTPGVVSVAAREAPEQLEHGGIETRAGDSEQDVLWEKLARQGPIAVLTSATGQTIGELRAGVRLRAAVQEACAVAGADGASTTFEEQWAIVESLPAWATSSTARDVAAGRPSELDAIGGAVVRAGARLGVPTPTIEEALAACPA
jgi:2-dehydropantoate 2-reductase